MHAEQDGPEQANYLLKLSETYRDYDRLIWLVPSWGIAISAGVIVAANQIGASDSNWAIPVNYVRASILLIGTILLFVLSIAIHKYRVYQSYSVPEPLPCPPFETWPSAGFWLQLALCLSFGVLLSLFCTQVFASFIGTREFSALVVLLLGPIVGIITCFLFECRFKETRSSGTTINTKHRAVKRRS